MLVPAKVRYYQPCKYVIPAIKFRVSDHLPQTPETAGTQLSIYERVYTANVIHGFAYRYVFAKQKFGFLAPDFKEGGKENDCLRLTVKDASSMSNARSHACQRTSFFFCRFSKFSSPAML